ncbi:MAG: tripartite tricarboxylate transporter TctA family protein [Noviherbaspirillum sp.]|nr:tripartite tricarboxylate transporter TctA family protein [Noviherbaspirillum sp.]
MGSAAGQAFFQMIDPARLMYLGLGCIMGLILGILPGIGGLAGTAMLLPFTFAMDPYSAFALLLGLGATVATGDPIPAILFGVPGGAASAATVLDGHPMAKRGEAGRALSAAYMSSLLGGIFGALLLAFTIPVLRPAMLYLGSPELLAFSLFGVSMVAVLSGSAPLRGIAASAVGMMIAMIGADPHTGTPRWTLGSIYLWDGLPITPLLLGIFALPELCDLFIGRVSIAANIRNADVYKGQWQGVKDCLGNWWLIVRCSWIGAGIGSIPGISGAVIDWLAYGHALRTEKGAADTFGKGDVRGVIASESSNNAKEGGALVPTIAFGVPGSAGMAILLGAFLVHGLVPGPEMLTKNLNITYAMIWSIALANILGAGLCYAFSPQFAKLATLRYTLILPAVLGIIYIGAFEASRSWGDLFSLLLFGVIGWLMKRFRWPRAPLILGVVLGDTIERYMFISIERFGLSWMQRPVVAALLLLAAIGLFRPLLQDIRSHGGVRKMLRGMQAPRFHPMQLFTVFVLLVIVSGLLLATAWEFNAKIIPLVVCTVGLIAVSLSLLNEMCRDDGSRASDKPGSIGDQVMEENPVAGDGEIGRRPAKRQAAAKIHMDLSSDTLLIPTGEIARRALRFFLYLVAFIGSMATIGLIPSALVFVILFMRLEGSERWSLVLTYALFLVIFIYIVFDQVMAVPWPQTLLGSWFPELKRFVPSL